MVALSAAAAFSFVRKEDFNYAVAIVETVTWLAGQPDYFDGLREGSTELDLTSSSGRRRPAKMFEWLAAALSYQGVSDTAARSYMAAHGRPAWRSISHEIRDADCPLLQSHWHFHGCGYRKAAYTCSQPQLLETCPLPRHEFRNGNLNQLAYSLFLFIRDVANGDLIGWIDQRLSEAEAGPPEGRLERMRQALIGPLTGVHGASYKVLSMAFSDLLMLGSARNGLWGEVGASLIAIDTLVHNFLVRTGILKRARAEHAYGPQCYGPSGCAAILSALSEKIDARQFNSGFPEVFPRFIQHAVWSYCAGEGLSVCNGNRIDDSARCQNRDCRLYRLCDRKSLI